MSENKETVHIVVYAKAGTGRSGICQFIEGQFRASGMDSVVVMNSEDRHTVREEKLQEKVIMSLPERVSLKIHLVPESMGRISEYSLDTNTKMIFTKQV